MDAQWAVAVRQAMDCVITCEHGGNRIPAPYRDLFRGHQALLDSHRGYDPGALIMARALAKAFAAPLVTSTVSRLLVDLNRSVGHPHLYSAATRAAPAEVRAADIAPPLPALSRASRAFGQAGDRGPRPGDPPLVAQLYAGYWTARYETPMSACSMTRLDRARRICASVGRHPSTACAPDLTVRRNYPYAGKGDGLTAWFRRRLPPGAYLGIELEVNQKHVLSAGRRWTAMRKVIVGSLSRALASRCAGTSA